MRPGQAMRKLTLAAPAVLVAVVLLLHGALPHGYHHPLIPPASAQAGHPAESDAPASEARRDQSPDDCPQPREHCDAGITTKVASPSRSGGSPLGWSIALPTSSPAMSAHATFVAYAERVRRHKQGPSHEELLVFRC